MSHNIDLNKINTRTDLAIDEINIDELSKISNIKSSDNINIITIDINEKTKDKFSKKIGRYITIEFDDVTDYNSGILLEKALTKELKKLMKKQKISDNSSCMVIGLGNEKSTPDSLGPLSINDIIVTSHFFMLGINVEEGFRCVSAFNPGVMGQTGIETSDIIYSLVKEIKPDFLIVIDALKASNILRVNRTLQITDAGINPGSGIGNTRKEISKDILGIPVIAVGIPTVVDTITITNDVFNLLENYFCYMKENYDKPKEKLKIVRTNIEEGKLSMEDKTKLFGIIGTLKEEDFKSLICEVVNPKGYNLIVTPKEIDFVIKRLSNIISTGVNNALHKNVTKF